MSGRIYVVVLTFPLENGIRVWRGGIIFTFYAILHIFIFEIFIEIITDSHAVIVRERRSPLCFAQFPSK